MKRERGQANSEKRSTHPLENYQDRCVSDSGSICVLDGYVCVCVCVCVLILIHMCKKR